MLPLLPDLLVLLRGMHGVGLAVVGVGSISVPPVVGAGLGSGVFGDSVGKGVTGDGVAFGSVGKGVTGDGVSGAGGASVGKGVTGLGVTRELGGGVGRSTFPTGARVFSVPASAAANRSAREKMVRLMLEDAMFQ